jgi:putative DNA base modification enzyme with NMAD domain
MPRHYAYRVDHDRDFAPHVERGLCCLCGCKTTTIERWADVGSWVVGIGGNNTGKPNALIYAMRVEQTPSYSQFKKTHSAHAAYLSGQSISPAAPVLVSTHFYYFGDSAKELPAELSRIVHKGRGCKRLSDTDILQLNKLVLRHYRCGKHGRPNNRPPLLCPRARRFDCHDICR